MVTWKNRIDTTELLISPLTEGKHTIMMNLSHLYVGILNDYDLIVSKLMRGTRVDFEDCLSLTKAHRAEIDIEKLIQHFYEMIPTFRISQFIGHSILVNAQYLS